MKLSAECAFYGSKRAYSDNENENVAPSPGLPSAQTSPPWRRAMC